MKILCVFGKYQYGQISRGLSTEYFSFIPAFEKLGYEVVFFDSWDRTEYSNFTELNECLISKVEVEKPDLIFSVQLGYEIWVETWDYIRSEFMIKTINWCTDDSWKYKEHSRFLATHFDLMITTYEEFLPKFKDENSNAMLSTWAVPIQWVQEPKKSTECKYKVTFVGAAHGDRKEKVDKLKNAGIEIECFGYGWDNGAIEADEIPRIFNDSIISLNFANSSGENQIKARVFEVTGSGGFLLTENAKNLDKVLKNNYEIAIFDNIDNCIEQVKFYLEDTNLRDSLVLNSFRKTSNNYTYLNRMKDIINTVETIEKKDLNPVDFSKAIKEHKKSLVLDCLKFLLIFVGNLIYDNEKAKRFSRRVVYEFSWRMFGSNTYKSKGIVGRMFYNE